MIKTARGLGRWIYKFVRSPLWASIIGTTQEIRSLPTKIVREAGLEESIEELKKAREAANLSLNVDEINKTADLVNQELSQTVEQARVEIAPATDENLTGLAPRKPAKKATQKATKSKGNSRGEKTEKPDTL